MPKLAVHNVEPTKLALVQLCWNTPGQHTLTTISLSEIVECAEAALEVILLIQTAYQDHFWLLNKGAGLYNYIQAHLRSKHCAARCQTGDEELASRTLDSYFACAL